ncbi:MAG: hypothetical protein R2684_17165 [Pyrinomonadaceae bacterium]
MNQRFGPKDRKSERGGAGVKLLAFLLFIGMIANALIQYLPVVYQAEVFKQEMQSAVVFAISVPSGNAKPESVVQNRLKLAINNGNLPVNTWIDVRQVKGVLTARVYYTRTIPLIPFGGYDYTYVFDHTATPAGYMFE